MKFTMKGHACSRHLIARTGNRTGIRCGNILGIKCGSSNWGKRLDMCGSSGFHHINLLTRGTLDLFPYIILYCRIGNISLYITEIRNRVPCRPPPVLAHPFHLPNNSLWSRLLQSSCRIPLLRYSLWHVACCSPGENE